ncbi:MAG: hypothetical protein AB2L20_11690 [Mangrovibacterium sp.]
MSIRLELYELKNICMDMAELGAANYAKQIGKKDLISQKDAYRRFGAIKIKLLVKMKMISSQRAGTAANSKKLYSIAEILSALKAEKLNTLINRI